MPQQAMLFEPQAPALPEGLRLQGALITPDEERALVAHFATLPFKEFEFQGFLGKRRVVSYGWQYDFNGGGLRRTEEMPAFLHPIRDKAAAFADVAPAELEHVLLTEYPPGATIGWHKDRSVFGRVIGISLGAPAVFRLRRKAGARWERASFTAAPRAGYLLDGPARSEWEHSIPAVPGLRHSITFRTLRERGK
jgi:alkylated DNA repair dioxygenase AlkB